MSNDFYEIDGKQYPRVTSILDLAGFNKQSVLMGWVAKIAREYLLGVLKTRAITKEDVYTAASKYREESKAALDFGSEFHNIVEVYFRGQKVNRLLNTEQKTNCFNRFLEWVKKENVVADKAEHAVCSRKHGYAGTLDAKGRLNGTEYIIDLKTSGGLYDSYPLQLAAYLVAYEEQSGETVDNAGIIWIPKTGKEYGWVPYKRKELLGYFEQFKKLLEFWYLTKGESK